MRTGAGNGEDVIVLCEVEGFAIDTGVFPGHVVEVVCAHELHQDAVVDLGEDPQHDRGNAPDDRVHHDEDNVVGEPEEEREPRDVVLDHAAAAAAAVLLRVHRRRARAVLGQVCAGFVQATGSALAPRTRAELAQVLHSQRGRTKKGDDRGEGEG